MKNQPAPADDNELENVPFIPGFHALCWAIGESIFSISFCGPTLDGGERWKEVLLILTCYWVIVAMIMIRRARKLHMDDVIFIVFALPFFLCIHEFLTALVS